MEDLGVGLLEVFMEALGTKGVWAVLEGRNLVVYPNSLGSAEIAGPWWWGHCYSHGGW